MTLVVALLAAGLSRRYGACDKLSAEIAGVPMLTRTAEAADAVGADYRVAVLRDEAISCHLPQRFEVTHCAGQMSDSVRSAVAFARSKDASRLLVMLADMPFVQCSSLSAVVSACREDAPSCLVGPDGLSPPACFPARWFDQLDSLCGDQGAGKLLTHDPRTKRIECLPQELQDIDTPSALSECSAKMAAPELTACASGRGCVKT